MVLKCVEAATGKEVWSSDLIKDHGGRNIYWENAASPLVEDGLVFVAGGVLLITLAVLLERQRRRLIRRMKTQTTEASN